MFVDGPDCRLWVRLRGTGDPVTVFAHGLTSSIEEIAPFGAATKGTRVFYDLRGHGRSDTPAEHDGYGYPAMLGDLRFIADHFGARQAFGVSVSADSLVLLMSQEPNRFDRVCLFIPGALEEPNLGTEHFAEMAADLERMTIEEFASKCLADPTFNLLFAKRPHWRRLVKARTLRMNGIGIPRALRAYANGPAPLPDPSSLAGVSAPVLILAHADDPVHDIAVAQRLAGLLSNSTLRTWDEPLAMLDDPAGFAALIAEFFSGADPVS